MRSILGGGSVLGVAVVILATGVALGLGHRVEAQALEPHRVTGQAGAWNPSALTLVPADQIPRFGSFWRVSQPNWPPTPCLPPALAGFPIYALPRPGSYLVDDSATSLAGLTEARSASLESEALSELLLSSLDETTPAVSMVPAYPTGALWMELTFSNSVPVVTLHGTQSTNVYEIMSKTDLTSPAWAVEAAVHGAANQDFTTTPLSMDNRTNTLFLWARNWSGVDENGNGIPDWWEWENFGGPQPADGDFDGDGISNLSEYLAETDPNTVAFRTSYTNDYVSADWVNGAVQLQNGVPAWMAFLIDATNFSSAVWVPYNPNFSAPLPAVDGRYWVQVGLKGRAPDSKPTWKATRISRDTTPPLVVLTNIAPGTISQPMVQLQGYSPERLASLRFDVVNAAGALTNREGSVLSQVYDVGQGVLTTNFFQCYDIDLTNGDNTVTLRARDLAGNETVTNFVFTLMSDTTPPAITLEFPQDGKTLAGDSFDIDGWLDDATATVIVSLTNSSGITNTYQGVVERNGRFWVQGLPLAGGDTSLGISGTDNWGNSSSTNITITRSGLSLTVGTIDPGQLYQSAISVSGGVGDSSYEVWVNGVQATVNGDGTWQADGVPVTRGGTAIFAVSAFAPAQPTGLSRPLAVDHVGSATADEVELQDNLDKPDRNYVESDALKTDRTLEWYDYWDDGSWTKISETFHYDYNWVDGEGGNGSESWQKTTQGSEYPEPETDSYSGTLTWSNSLEGILHVTVPMPGGTNYEFDVPRTLLVGMEHSEVNDTLDADYLEEDYVLGVSGVGHSTDTCVSSGQTTLAFQAGGKSVAHQEGVLVVTASAREMLDTRAEPPFSPTAASLAIAPDQISVGGLGSLDSGSIALGTIQVGEKKQTTPKAPGDVTKIGSSAGAYFLVSQTKVPALTVTNRARTTIGVGEEVDLSGMPDNTIWTVSGGGTLTAPNGGGTTLTAPSRKSSVTVTATVTNANDSKSPPPITFEVLEPEGVGQATIYSTHTHFFDIGSIGAWMTINAYIAPTSVSFRNVWIKELPGGSATGYGAYTNPPAHVPSEGWARLRLDNGFTDQRAEFNLSAQTVTSGNTWNIPVAWTVNPNGNETNNLIRGGWSQSTTQEAPSQTVTLEKFGKSVQRSTNNVTIPAITPTL